MGRDACSDVYKERRCREVLTVIKRPWTLFVVVFPSAVRELFKTDDLRGSEGGWIVGIIYLVAAETDAERLK